MNSMLRVGPWMIGNKPLILEPQAPTIKFDHGARSIVPLWVKFPNLNLHLWSVQELSLPVW